MNLFFLASASPAMFPVFTGAHAHLAFKEAAKVIGLPVTHPPGNGLDFIFGFEEQPFRFFKAEIG
ncbi:MAG: hypothetical protein WAR00_06845 [bacterium]